MSSVFAEITENHQARHAHNASQVRCEECGGYVPEAQVIETENAKEWVCPSGCGIRRKTKL